MIIFYSVTSSINAGVNETFSVNAGVNETFSVTLSVAMIHLVVNEALLFSIFTRALYKIMQRGIFSFSIFVNPTRVIQANIPG